jgi:hypothetical protein
MKEAPLTPMAAVRTGTQTVASHLVEPLEDNATPIKYPILAKYLPGKIKGTHYDGLKRAKPKPDQIATIGQRPNEAQWITSKGKKVSDQWHRMWCDWHQG